MNIEQIKIAAQNSREEICLPMDRWDEDMYKDGFIDGANWRIKSVWHNMKKEEPQVYGGYVDKEYPQIPCLVYGKLSTGIGHGVRYWNVTEKCWDDEGCDDYECEKDAIEQWTYLDDLLPGGKETVI